MWDSAASPDQLLPATSASEGRPFSTHCTEDIRSAEGKCSSKNITSFYLFFSAFLHFVRRYLDRRVWDPPPPRPFFFFSCLFLLPRPCSHHPPLLQTYRSSHDQSRRVGLFSFLLFLLLTFIISSSVSTLLRARFLALHLFRSKRQKPSARAYFCGRWWQSCFFPCCLGFP